MSELSSGSSLVHLHAMTMDYRRFVAHLGSRVRLFTADESGQDFVEYALAAGFVGIAGYLVLMALDADILSTYASWIDPGSGMPSLWDPPDPAGGGS